MENFFSKYFFQKKKTMSKQYIRIKTSNSNDENIIKEIKL